MSTSGATAKLPAVPQLNGNNIHLWKIKLVQHLRPQGLAQYVQKNIMAPDTLEEREKWEKERVAVFDIILAHTEDVIDQLVEEGGWDMDTQEDPKDLVDIAVSLFSKKKEKKKSADVIGTDEHPNSEEDAETFISSESIQPGSPLRESQNPSTPSSTRRPSPCTSTLIDADYDKNSDAQRALQHATPRYDNMNDDRTVQQGASTANLFDRVTPVVNDESRIKMEEIDERWAPPATLPETKIVIDLTEEDGETPENPSKRSPKKEFCLNALDLTEDADTSSLSKKFLKLEEDSSASMLDLAAEEDDVEDRPPNIHKKLQSQVPELAVAVERRAKAYEKFDAKRTELKLLRQELEALGPDAASGLEDIIQERINEAEKLLQDFREVDTEAKKLREESTGVYVEAKAMCQKNSEMLSDSMNRDINLN